MPLIAELVGASRPTVNLWRGRYLEHGLEGLVDVHRPGRPKVVDDAAIITATLRPPPKSLGVTHWSSRLLAPRLGVHHSTVTKAWKRYGVRPWKADTFKFSSPQYRHNGRQSQLYARRNQLYARPASFMHARPELRPVGPLHPSGETLRPGEPGDAGS